MPLTTITIRVAANTAGVGEAFAGVNVEVKNLADNVKATSSQVSRASASFTSLQATAVAMGNAIYDVFKGIATAIGGTLEKAVELSTAYNHALIALTSVSRAFGTSSSDAMAAAQSLSADGLLPLSQAAVGLKNLLATGFNLKQATDLMNTFKDSATFARKSGVEFGDSIVRATEGIKNTQSRLVDASGITKNLSVIMKEAGFSLQDLTDKTKGHAAQQALYNGVMKEGSAFSGDAARSLNTFGGAMTALKTGYSNVLAASGDYITRSASVQIALKTTGEWVNKLNVYLRSNKDAYVLVSDGLVILVKALSAAVTGIGFLGNAFLGLLVGLDTIGVALSEFQTKVFTAVSTAAGLAGLLDPANAKTYLSIMEKAGDATTQAGLATSAFKVELQKNTTAALDWNKKLDDAHDALQKLIADIKASRGAMSNLEDASRKAGDTINDTGDRVDKAAEKIKKKIADLINSFVKVRLGWAGAFDNFEWKVKLEPPDAEFNKWSKALDDKIKVGFAGLGTLGFTVPLKAPKIPTEFEQAWQDTARRLPEAVERAFQNDTNVFVAIGNTIGETFGQAFAKAAKKAIETGKPLSAIEKEIGYLAETAQALAGGYSVGLSSGSVGKGILQGALTGAAAGIPLAGVTMGGSIAIGAAIGGIGGMVGGSQSSWKNFKEEMDAIRTAKEQWLAGAGGYDALSRAADRAGTSAAAAGDALSRAYNATSMNAFTVAVSDLNAALTVTQKHLDALGTAMAAINTRAAQFAKPFQAITDKMDVATAAMTPDAQGHIDEKAAAQGAADLLTLNKQLAAAAQVGQAEFERLGIYATAAFSGIVKEGGSAYDAITTLAPTFQILQDGVEKFGLASTPVIDELLADFKLVNDVNFKPLFDQIATTGQLLNGLISANALSPEAFQAAAADIGASIQTIIDKGGDASRTLALSQPVLQTLWENEQKYGTITDETTKSLLDQAEKQGLVGAQMEDVNKQILKVLLAIGKVLGADLPDYFDKLKKPAEDAANSIENSFNGITIDPIKIRLEYPDGLPPGRGGDSGGASVPALARGGIVRRPTLALIGEAGPEAVVPLTGAALGATPFSYQTDIYLDSERIARATAKKLPKVLRGVGIG